MRLSEDILREALDGSARRFVKASDATLNIEGFKIGSNDADGYHDDMLYLLEAGTSEDLPRHYVKLPSKRKEDETHPNDPAISAANKLAETFAAYARWDEKLDAALWMPDPIHEILDVGTEMIGQPIALFDPARTLIEYGGILPDGWRDTIWGAVLERGYTPDEYFTAEELERFAFYESTESSFVLRVKNDHCHDMALAKVLAGPIMLGWLAMVVFEESGATTRHVSLLEHLASKVGLLYANRHQEDRDDSALESSVQDLLEEKSARTRSVQAYLAAKGWTRTDGFLVALLRSDVPETLSLSASFEMRIRTAFPRGLVLRWKSYVVLVERGDVTTLGLERVLERLTSLSRTLRASCGCSEPCPDFLELRYFALQAEAALSFCEPGETKSYRDCYAAHVRTILLANHRREELCHPVILGLARQNEAGRDFVNTLYTFLTCGCNVSKAAKRLYLHRNTVNYRVQRLEELLGIDFAEATADELFYLEMSCMLANARKRLTGGIGVSTRLTRQPPHPKRAQ